MPVTQFKKNLNRTFQFSEGARLYAANLDLVNVIQESREKDALRLLGKFKDAIDEVRSEAIRSISQFGNAITESLVADGFGHKRTTPQGQYSGGRFNHFWANRRRKWDTGTRIMIPIPDPNKLKPTNDRIWKTVWGCFDPVVNNRLKVWVAKYSCPERRLFDVVNNASLGEYLGEDSWSYMIRVSLEPANPVGSAVQRLRSLLRALRSVDK